MSQFLIIYNDGSVEQRTNIKAEFIHLFEKGIIKFLFNVLEGCQYTHGKGWQPVAIVDIPE